MTQRKKRLSGAQILIETLIEQGVTDVFGYPGGTVLDIYDALFRAKRQLRHILTADEQGAAHAADGYARSTGKVGVVIATSGPGATNLVTGIATAMLDSVPMVAITGNVATSMIGRDSFQEVDITGVTVPITKHNFFVTDVRTLADTVREAFQIAREGRPGPVLIDIPKDVQQALCTFTPAKEQPSAQEESFDDAALDEAAALIAKAQKPYLYIGGGALGCELGKQIVALAEKIDAVIGCSFMGLTAVPTDEPRFLGMQGMHGRFASTAASRQADLILGVGVRFSDRATGSLERIKTRPTVIQLDVDLAELGKNVPLDLGIQGDLRLLFPRLCARVKPAKHPEWMRQVQRLREKESADLLAADSAQESGLSPRKIFEIINASTDNTTVFATDVGQHQMWTAQFAAFRTPHTLVSSGGLGTMGYGLGAAIGACIGTGAKTVLLTGDGSFGMNLTELATAVTEKLPLVIVLFNNRTLGMVHQLQHLFYKKRFAGTDLSARRTDFVKLADAFGAKGTRVETPAQFETAFKAAMQSKTPALIEVLIDPETPVLPMLPQDESIDNIITTMTE